MNETCPNFGRDDPKRCALVAACRCVDDTKTCCYSVTSVHDNTYGIILNTLFNTGA